MKKVYTCIACLCTICTLLVSNVKSQNTFPASGSVGIGTTTPNTSALLEVKSTTQGVLVPRMTLGQRNDIPSPATGLLIYQTNNTPGFYYFNNANWVALGAVNKTLSNLSSPTQVNVSLLPDSAGKRDFGAGTAAWNDIYFHGKWFKDSTVFLSSNTTNLFLGPNVGAKSIGTYNTGLGVGALVAIKPANFNTAIGYFAMHADSSGSENVALGYGAMQQNVSGGDNVALGMNALTDNVSGYTNVAVGSGAMFENTTGYDNAVLGSQALFHNKGGYRNVALGSQAVSSNSTGGDNIGIGGQALYTNATGDGNVAIGTNALFTSDAVYNVGVGYYALYKNNSGFRNTAMGTESLTSNTTGGSNTALGDWASYSNTLGSTNTAVGESALYANTTGHSNVAIGVRALATTKTTSNLVAVGDSALLHLNSSTGNCTAVGSEAGILNTTGGNNTYVGYHAGNTVTTGSSNTIIGYGADVSTGTFANATALGNSAVATGSNKVRIGNASVTSIGGQVGWTSFSDERIKTNVQSNVPGLAFINLLKPVTYNFNIDKQQSLMGRKNDEQWDGKYDIQKIAFTGFLAQDVETAAKKIKYDFSGVDAPKNSNDVYGLRYSDFVVPLVKAVQELSKMNEDKDAKIDDLQKQINELKAMIIGNKNTSSNGNSTGASLEQNVPNPATNSTRIGYTLPQTFSSAQIVVTDKNGKVLKQIPVAGNGKGSVTLDAGALASGAYQYSLYVDNKLIASKQMVLAR